jgi:hypothetical protein
MRQLFLWEEEEMVLGLGAQVANEHVLLFPQDPAHQTLVAGKGAFLDGMRSIAAGR